jgi:2-iminobutanoate/2-iminopropanoate deaminase
MREILTSSNMPAPKFRYSPCVKTGPFYHMAGMIGLDFKTGALVDGGVYYETKKILDNLVAGLKDFDLNLEHLVSATVYVCDFSTFPEVNRAWEELFVVGITPPARTAVGVSALPLYSNIEIEFKLYKEH